jgi:Spy/CpxP family protein refolding chaperone
MRTQVVAWLATALVAGPLAAQELELPPGRWWDDPRLAERLALSGAQQAELREVVTEHARRMIDLKAETERAALDLAEAVRRDEFEPAAVRTAFAAFQTARARLENERFEMLLAVRGLLSAEQWRTMQELRRRFNGPRDEAAPGPRRAPG